MKIREASINDLKELQELYYETIININCKDYNADQIAAWASTANRTKSLAKKIKDQYFYVAEKDHEIIVGFASLENSGYLDMMYVHKNFQNMGIAKALLDKIIEKAKALSLSEIITNASITAKVFFEKNGFQTVKEQTVFINAIGLTNYKMKRGITYN